MKIHGLSLGPWAGALAILAAATVAPAVTQDFNSLPAGTVVAGLLPGGGTSPGNLFPDFTLDVVNNGGGPSSAILFNSSAPTGGDDDLGTPNQDFGGPGVGPGGGLGMPGQNDVALGNLLIVAEDIIDVGGDGLVDDPDDEAGGGVIGFDFIEPTTIFWIKIVDMDDGEGAAIRLYDAAKSLVATVYAATYGDNSAQTIDLSQYEAITRMEVDLYMSGAIGEIEYRVPPTSTRPTTWGTIKSNFR
ncbi:MAG: hypothetical protein ABIK65_01505 [Candidatus Eisenbacteria bacterium]